MSRHPADLIAVSIFAIALIVSGGLFAAADFGWIDATRFFNASDSHLKLPGWVAGAASLPFVAVGVGLLVAVWMEGRSRGSRVSLPGHPVSERQRSMGEFVFTLCVSVIFIFIGGLLTAASLGLVKLTGGDAPISVWMALVGLTVVLAAVLIGTSAVFRWWNSVR